MKSLLTTLITLILSLSLQAQTATVLGGGLGYSTKNSGTTDLVFGIEFPNKVLLQGNIIAHMDNFERRQKAFTVKGGYKIPLRQDDNNLEILIGYVYNSKSTVWKQRNTHSPGVSLAYVNNCFTKLKLKNRGRQSHQTGQFYFSLTYIDKTVVGAIGLRLHVIKERVS